MFQERDPFRIPGYIQGCHNTTYFGYVMRDFANRMFFRAVGDDSKSIVLVVAPGANQTLQQLQQQQNLQQPNLYKHYQYNVGKSMLIASLQNGHQVYAVDGRDKTNNTTTVDYWWETTFPPILSSEQPATTPSIWLTVFDPTSIGQEDMLVQGASNFLETASSKYIIFRVSSQLSSPGYHMNGLDAAELLWNAGYSLQILSASHSSQYSSGKYGPNAYLSSKTQVQLYLRHGAALATANGMFRSYLFASKSKDLAIPSRREFIETSLFEHPDRRDVVLDPTTKIPYRNCTNPRRLSKTANEVQFGDGVGGQELLLVTCYDQLLTQFEIQKMNLTTLWYSGSNPQTSEALCVYCQSYSAPDASSPGRQRLVSNRGMVDTTACATRFLPNNNSNNDHKTTPSSITSTTTETFEETNKEEEETYDSPSQKLIKNNILVILIQQLSREQFHIMFPNTQDLLLQSDGFTLFSNYTAVTANSKSSHDALFKGSSSSSSTTTTTNRLDKREELWLWDELRGAGYATMVAENECGGPDSAFWSTNNQEESSHYGGQLQKLFCHGLYDFYKASSSRDCVNEAPSGQHVLKYASQFIHHHHQKEASWAAFLSFTDGNEDTGSLVGALDVHIGKFLKDLQTSTTTSGKSAHRSSLWDRTTIAIVSDHGLNYGYYSNTFSGFRERMEPILYLKASKQMKTALKYNKDMYTTPLDVYKTLYEASLGKSKIHGQGNQQSATSSQAGQSLFRPLPQNRLLCEETGEISLVHCEFRKNKYMEKEISLKMPPPPSMLSFYADIPKTNKFQTRTISLPTQPQRATVTKGCRCASQLTKWRPCDSHPWETVGIGSIFGKSGPNSSKEYFMIVDCPGRPLHLELRINRNPYLLKKTDQRILESPYASKDLPNIIFLEIDSVSLAYAERHFPKTREFLKKFRIQRTEDGSYDCPFGMCSADFSSRVSLVGANSVPNQVAALSGCVSSSYDELCGYDETAELGIICNDTAVLHYGLRLQRLRPAAKQAYWCRAQPEHETLNTPWLFGFGDAQGYTNYFGEEFCYEGSPYVTQGNVFPAFYAGTFVQEFMSAI